MAITVRSVDPDWAEAQAIEAYHTLRQATPAKVAHLTPQGPQVLAETTRTLGLPSPAEPRVRRLFWIALALALLVAVSIAVTTHTGRGTP